MLKVLQRSAWLLQIGLVMGLCAHAPVGVAAAVPLLATLHPLVRGSLRGFALNSLLLPFYAGFFLAYRAQPGFLLLACVAAAAFVAGILYVRGRAAEIRRVAA